LDAAGGLHQDFDVAEAAFGGASYAQELVESVLQAGGDGVNFLRELLHKARHGLNVHDAFVKGLLCGMAVVNGSECHLVALERGAETSLAWKKLIAEYVGLRTVAKLQLLRLVAKNLENIDAYESNDDLSRAASRFDDSIYSLFRSGRKKAFDPYYWYNTRNA
jgi:hypothetical protein